MFVAGVAEQAAHHGAIAVMRRQSCSAQALARSMLVHFDEPAGENGLVDEPRQLIGLADGAVTAPRFDGVCCRRFTILEDRNSNSRQRRSPWINERYDPRAQRMAATTSLIR